MFDVGASSLAGGAPRRSSHRYADREAWAVYRLESLGRSQLIWPFVQQSGSVPSGGEVSGIRSLATRSTQRYRTECVYKLSLTYRIVNTTAHTELRSRPRSDAHGTEPSAIGSSHHPTRSDTHDCNRSFFNTRFGPIALRRPSLQPLPNDHRP